MKLDACAGAPGRSLALPKAQQPLPRPDTLIDFGEGWARRPKASNTRFTPEQIDFLKWAFNGCGTVNNRKIKHSEARVRMVEKFTDSNSTSPYFRGLVLSEKQIQSWFSSKRAELNKEQVQAAQVVISRAISEVSVACELGEGVEDDDVEGDDNGGAGSGIGDLEVTCKGGQVGEGGESESWMQGGSVVPAADGGLSDSMEISSCDELVNPQGSLWLVVCEEWEEDRGFEVWELGVGVSDGLNKVLTPEQLVSVVQGRKWVHESDLLDEGQVCQETRALKDKGKHAVLLGKAGSRRFAPRLGRSGDMKMIEPASYGAMWLQIEGLPCRNFIDRAKKLRTPSFVFTSEDALIDEAYQMLCAALDE